MLRLFGACRCRHMLLYSSSMHLPAAWDPHPILNTRPQLAPYPCKPAASCHDCPAGPYLALALRRLAPGVESQDLGDALVRLGLHNRVFTSRMGLHDRAS